MLEFSQEKFSGPLGLLLSLIEGEEMDITEIALAKIADDYVAYVRRSPEIEPEEMADFLVIAAKLLYIKSKALLPYLYAEADEEAGDDLEKQLRMYKEFVAASRLVKEQLASRRFLYLPPAVSAKKRRAQFNLPVFSPPAKLTADYLREQYLMLLERWEKAREAPLAETSLEPKISIEERIENIRRALAAKVKVNFSRLLAGAGSRIEVIVSLLAVLELAKQKELLFEQDELFSEIHISRPAA